MRLPPAYVCAFVSFQTCSLGGHLVPVTPPYIARLKSDGTFSWAQLQLNSPDFTLDLGPALAIRETFVNPFRSMFLPTAVGWSRPGSPDPTARVGWARDWKRGSH